MEFYPTYSPLSNGTDHDIGIALLEQVEILWVANLVSRN